LAFPEPVMVLGLAKQLAGRVRRSCVVEAKAGADY